jgi:spore germination cell wall hydrolase CwlJ-like protein
MEDPIQELAAVIYGEAANQKPEVMQMVGSTVLNRLNSGRSTEFGATLPEIIQKGYYAASGQNEPYKQAITGKFPDKIAEKAYKQSYAIASGLVKGTIKPAKGMFYFTKSEIAKLRKNKKAFDFSKVKNVGDSGDYQVFDY